MSQHDGQGGLDTTADKENIGGWIAGAAADD
jgi:hypothetical protein